MNDLERELRELLRNKADEAWSRPEAPLHVLRRARRRQVMTAAVAGLTAAVVAVGSFAGVQLFGRRTSTPGTQGQTVTDTLNGITITYPEGWFLADPVATGIEPEPGPGEERLVLLLSKHDPSIPGLIGCPGQVQDRAPGEALMTVQEQVPVVGEHDFASWPVALEQVFEGEPESEPTAAGCYGGWTFYRARFTSEGRFFQATVGVAPDATTEDRQAMFDAFASMQFAPASAVERSTAVIATGEAGGERWSFSVSRDPTGLFLELSHRMGATGFGFGMPRRPLEAGALTLGRGTGRETVVIGIVSKAVDRVVVEYGDGLEVEGEILPLPEELSPGELEAFVATVPGTEGFVVALDETGARVGSTVYVSGVLPEAPETTSDRTAFVTGEAAGHRWTLWGAMAPRGAVALELEWEDGATAAAWDSVPGSRDLEFTFEEFGAVDVEVVIFGVVSERVDRIVLRGPGGETEAETVPLPARPNLEAVRAFVLVAARPLSSSLVVALDADGNELEALPFEGGQ